MEAKCLIIGDLHFRMSALQELKKITQHIIGLIDDMRPDIVVLLGDILHDHERVHSMVMNEALQFLREMKRRCKTYVIVGNHDMYNNQVFLEPFHWMTALTEWDDLVVVDRVVSEYVGPYRLTFCPYVPPGRFLEALATEEAWSTSRCILAHQEIQG